MGLKKFGEFEGTHNEALKETKDNAWKVLDGGEREILGVEWRAAGKWGTVGIVAVHNKTKDHWVAYRGIADDKGEQQDAVSIADYGSKVLDTEAKAYFPNIKLKYKMED